MLGFEEVLVQRAPEVVVVVGDVNSTAACALVTAKIQLNGRRPLLVHVEAGLRSCDRNMPEEVNRIVTDALSDVLFTTCRDAGDSLHKEGVPADRVEFFGKPVINALRMCLPAADRCGFI